MKVESGKRLWLVAWAGKNENGEGWADSWEPTSFVREQLRRDYLEDRHQRQQRIIDVDVRPLDNIIQRSLAPTILGARNNSFGLTHTVHVGALTLSDLAAHHLRTVAEQFQVPIKEVYNPKDKSTTRELRLGDPKHLGEFCAFEKYMPPRHGVKSVRFLKRGDLVAVGVIYLRYYDNKREPGCVTFEYEVQTVKINGTTGSLTPPHLAQSSGHVELLKTDEHKGRVADYVRGLVPLTHPLHANGWTPLKGLQEV